MVGGWGGGGGKIRAKGSSTRVDWFTTNSINKAKPYPSRRVVASDDNAFILHALRLAAFLYGFRDRVFAPFFLFFFFFLPLPSSG